MTSSTGRSIKEADERGLLDELLTKYFTSVSSDLEFGYQFFNLKVAKEFIPPAAFRQSLKKSNISRSGVSKKVANLLHVTLMETLKPSLSQFVSSEHKMVVDEVTQIGLIESCLLKKSKIRGAWDSVRLFSAGHASE